MKVYAALDARLPLADVPAAARRVEALGFDGVHIPETVHDSLAVALLAAEHTSSVTIRTAITLAFVRSPTLVAYSAWDLARFSRGRFELGLGTQIRQNIEDRYGMPWTEPVARMGEYLGALRELFDAFATGGSPQFEGETYRITRLQPYFNPGQHEGESPSLHLGAVNRGMCELAGRMADGVITHSTNSDPGYLRDLVIPSLQVGAAQTGRPVPTVVAAATVATGPDKAAVKRARSRQRRLMAFLYSTPAYQASLERQGMPELSQGLRDLIRADRWDELEAVITNDVLDALVLSGTYRDLPELVVARYGGLVDGVVMALPEDAGDDGDLREAISSMQAARL